MKTLLMISCFLICSAQAFSQWHRLPRRVEFTLARIEQALRTGDPGSIEDLRSSGITMRFEDSLY
jgi:hypothetical protein